MYSYRKLKKQEHTRNKVLEFKVFYSINMEKSEEGPSERKHTFFRVLVILVVIVVVVNVVVYQSPTIEFIGNMRLIYDMNFTNTFARHLPFRAKTFSSSDNQTSKVRQSLLTTLFKNKLHAKTITNSTENIYWNNLSGKSTRTVKSSQQKTTSSVLYNISMSALVNFNLSSLTDNKPLPGSQSSTGTQGPLCSNISSPEPLGPIKLNLTVPSWAVLNKQLKDVKPGGWYTPACAQPDRIAVIIPYRDRDPHLRIFLQNMHPFLQRQNLEYRIFVIEQEKGLKFNRAILMNIGFSEASKLYDFKGYVFHDVDLLPEDDRVRYGTPASPTHLSPAYSKFKYKMPYGSFFGGVTAFAKQQFIKTNGFSNKYFGWGGEDDDLQIRVIKSQQKITRYSNDIGKYKMLLHSDNSKHADPKRFSLVTNASKRVLVDGLNSLEYTVLKTELQALYTWVLVTCDEKKIMSDQTAKRTDMKFNPVS